MTVLKRLVIVGLLAAGALFIGVSAGLAVIGVANWIAPFRDPEDDDTLREFIPAALAFMSSALTSAVIFVLGLRALLARWRARSSGDIAAR